MRCCERTIFVLIFIIISSNNVLIDLQIRYLTPSTMVLGCYKRDKVLPTSDIEIVDLSRPQKERVDTTWQLNVREIRENLLSNQFIKIRKRKPPSYIKRRPWYDYVRIADPNDPDKSIYVQCLELRMKKLWRLDDPRSYTYRYSEPVDCSLYVRPPLTRKEERIVERVTRPTRSWRMRNKDSHKRGKRAHIIGEDNEWSVQDMNRRDEMIKEFWYPNGLFKYKIPVPKPDMVPDWECCC